MYLQWPLFLASALHSTPLTELLPATSWEIVSQVLVGFASEQWPLRDTTFSLKFFDWQHGNFCEQLKYILVRLWTKYLPYSVFGMVSSGAFNGYKKAGMRDLSNLEYEAQTLESFKRNTAYFLIFILHSAFNHKEKRRRVVFIKMWRMVRSLCTNIKYPQL